MTESISPTWFALWMHCHLEAHPQNSAQVFISFMVEFYGILKEPLKLGTANMFFTQLTYYFSHVVQFTCSAVIFPYVIGFHNTPPAPQFIFNWQFFTCSTCFYFSHVFFLWAWCWFPHIEAGFIVLSFFFFFFYTCHLSCVKTMWSHIWHEATVGHQVGAICLVLSWCACHGPYILKRQEQESVKGVYNSQYS